jgi:predicted DNA-binding ribbon-helix-helix protein
MTPQRLLTDQTIDITYLRMHKTQSPNFPRLPKLEDAFWVALQDIARSRDIPLSVLMAEIYQQKGSLGFATAARIYALNYYRLNCPISGGFAEDSAGDLLGHAINAVDKLKK